MVNWIRPQIISATRRSIALIPLMQVLLALEYNATGANFLVIGETLGYEKDVTTRVGLLHRVSKACVQWEEA